jgi:hypothetical protein
VEDFGGCDRRHPGDEVIGLLLALGPPAGVVSAGGAQVSWWFEADDLVVLLEAHAPGWVAVGFNQAPELANSRLVLAAVADGRAVAEEHHAVPPQHPKVRNLVVRAFSETDGWTRALVAVPRQPSISGTIGLHPGVPVAVTVAFSREDGFDHHSQWRGLTPNVRL